MFEALEADRYSINIQKLDDNAQSDKNKSDRQLYNIEFIFCYDKNDEGHRNTFQNSIVYFKNAATALSVISHPIIEIDKENLILKLSLTATFDVISDTIVGEFINYGHLGKATISQLLTMVSYATVDMVKKIKDSPK
jgi:hypothetical protein